MSRAETTVLRRQVRPIGIVQLMAERIVGAAVERVVVAHPRIAAGEQLPLESGRGVETRPRIDWALVHHIAGLYSPDLDLRRRHAAVGVSVSTAAARRGRRDGSHRDKARQGDKRKRVSDHVYSPWNGPL